MKRKQKLTAANSVRGIFLGGSLNRGLAAPTPGLLTEDRNGEYQRSLKLPTASIVTAP
jgi:hypothetical protein